jgi:hypothetical protein
VPAPLAEHLAKITVDVKTVTLAKGPDAALLARATSGPLPAADGKAVRPEVLEYAVKMDMGGRSMEMSVKRTVEESMREAKACWRVTDVVTMPMGSMTSSYDLDRQSLVPVRFEASGMATSKLDFTATSVTGEMGAGGQSMPVNAKLDAPVFGDDAAFVLVLSALPLAAGYETTYRTFEASKQKARPMRLKVGAAQSVSVPAGTFEALVVETEPLDGEEGGRTTLHVTREAPHRVVKSSAKLPAQMGGGTMTSELKSVASAEKVGAK